jgi:histidyl-tRNA synthetase
LEIRSNSGLQTLAFQVRDYLLRCGYISLELPIIELADLFLLKAGDRAFQSLFTFEDGKQYYALRPEFTAQAVNLYVQSESKTHPIRWQFAGSVFRREPAKLAGEHYEIGGEFIGAQGSHIDAEIIGTAISSLKKIGILQSKLILGNIALLHQIIREKIADSRVEQFILGNIAALNNAGQGINYLLELYDHISFRNDEETNQLTATIDDKHTQALSLNSKQIFMANVTHTGTRSQEEIFSRLEYKLQRSANRLELASVLATLQSLCAISAPPRQAFREIRSVLQTVGTDGTHQLISYWEDLITSLTGFEIPVDDTLTIAPGLVRAWDYYTGIVFDIYDSHSNTHLGGGGRYDDLAQLMGAEEKVPAIGFVLNVDNLLEVKSLTENDNQPSIDIQYLPTDAHQAFKWATMLRDRGFSIRLIDKHPVDISSHSLTLVNNSNLLINGEFGQRVFSHEDFESLVALLQKDIDRV